MQAACALTVQASPDAEITATSASLSRQRPVLVPAQEVSVLTRLEAWLSQPRASLWLAALSLVLCVPCLGAGLQADDLLFPWQLEHGVPPWSLFQMDPGSAAETRATGYLAWWASPQLEARFLRPIASLSHALDFCIWPHATWWMHLQNVLIYAASVAVAARLYRGTLPTAAAALASLLFAIDDSHALSAGWISGRNTLLALLFALLTLEAQLRFHRTGRLADDLLRGLPLTLALATAEAGVWAFALVFAHVVVYQPRGLREKLRALALPLVLASGWAALYVALHCGLRGSSFYRDARDPLTALLQGALDLPVWFQDAFGVGGLPFALLYPTTPVRVASVAASAGLFYLLAPSLHRSRACQFHALSFLCCLAPLIMTVPTSRVLLAPSFGAIGWIACAVTEARHELGMRAAVTRRVLLTLHLGYAALMFFPALGATGIFAHGSQELVRASAPGRDVVLVQSPVELITDYAMLELGTNARAQVRPRSLHQLYAGTSRLEVERVGARTLDITSKHGWGHAPIERVFCTEGDLPRQGSEVRVASFVARVLEVNSERLPTRVRFTFEAALESPSFVWLNWERSHAVQWHPPAVGERTTLPALPPFFLALSR
jgi:hypothetical protein